MFVCFWKEDFADRRERTFGAAIPALDANRSNLPTPLFKVLKLLDQPGQ